MLRSPDRDTQGATTTSQSSPVTRRPWLFSLLTSLAAAVVALIWLTVPQTYPYGSGDSARAGVNHLIEREPAVALLLTAAVVGILLAAGALLGGANRVMLRVAGAGAVLETLFFAFVLSDSAVMSGLGYLVALTAPIGLVLLMVLVGRRWPPIGLALALLLLIMVVVGSVTGAMATVVETVGTYLGNFLSSPSGFIRIGWSYGMAAVAACWAWAAVTTLLRLRSDKRPEKVPGSKVPSAAPRWGRAVTIAAALCPLPYGLIRATWLTPWPLGGKGLEGFVITGTLPAVARIQGGLFALACAVGVVLTLGLISRWGEVFPRWVPGVSGRPVPIMLAVVPGGLVAAVITISAPGMLLAPIEEGDPLLVAYNLLAFPFPIWGPLLGAAVFAYWMRRTYWMRRRGSRSLIDIAGPGQQRPTPAN